MAAFVFLYVPQFLSPTGVSGAAPSDVVASVDGRRITAMDFQRSYAMQLDQLRANAGASLNDDLIRQLQIGPRLLQQMVNREAVVAEAERLGLSVSDGELRERLIRFPAFQVNGQFVGSERYRQILDQARPPQRPADFEARLRSDILAEKLQAALTGWVRVSDAEIDEEFQRRNEKVQLDVAVFNGSQFEAGIVPTDADIEAEFKAHPDNYRTPEKRRVELPDDRRGHAARHHDGDRPGSRRPATTRTGRCIRRRSRSAPATSSSRPRARTKRPCARWLRACWRRSRPAAILRRSPSSTPRTPKVR